jgi:hypothetical protein
MINKPRSSVKTIIGLLPQSLQQKTLHHEILIAERPLFVFVVKSVEWWWIACSVLFRVVSDFSLSVSFFGLSAVLLRLAVLRSFPCLSRMTDLRYRPVRRIEASLPSSNVSMAASAKTSVSNPRTKHSVSLERR